MHPSRIRLAGLAAFTIAIAGCAATQVNSYVARGVDLRAHRTYNWAPSVERSIGDPRLDNNRFFQERVQAAIEEQLGRRGFHKTAFPDLLVHYHASVAQEIRIGDDDDGNCEDCRPEVFDEGTLLIDLVDARSDRLFWRGWASGSIDGVIDDQKWMEQRIDDAVARIMRELPPGL